MRLEENPIDPIEVEAKKYYKRQEDGREAVNNLMAELRLNAKVNNYPRIVNKTIEDAFMKVTESVERGWWITAKEECELVVVGGYVTQELWDRIYTTINDYILTSY